jgi:hypothetical protein
MVAKTSRAITSSALTTCAVVKQGQGIRLDFLDRAGEPASIEFPFEQAHSIIMTLPHLLAQALRMQTLDPAARYVFSLDKWALEGVNNETLVVTLTAEGGFAVSFSVPSETCKAIGFALRHEARSASERPNAAGSSNPVTLN